MTDDPQNPYSWKDLKWDSDRNLYPHRLRKLTKQHLEELEKDV